MVYNCIPPMYKFYPVAMAGILFIMCISLIFTYFCLSTIIYLGQNSLVIMCIHDPIKRMVIALISRFLSIETTYLRHDVLCSILITLTILILCYPLIHIINRYCPYILGISRLNTNNKNNFNKP